MSYFLDCIINPATHVTDGLVRVSSASVVTSLGGSFGQGINRLTKRPGLKSSTYVRYLLESGNQSYILVNNRMPGVTIKCECEESTQVETVQSWRLWNHRPDIARSPKEEHQWPHKRDWCLSKCFQKNWLQ